MPNFLSAIRRDTKVMAICADNEMSKIEVC